MAGDGLRVSAVRCRGVLLRMEVFTAGGWFKPEPSTGRLKLQTTNGGMLGPMDSPRINEVRGQH